MAVCGGNYRIIDSAGSLEYLFSWMEHFFKVSAIVEKFEQLDPMDYYLYSHSYSISDFDIRKNSNIL